MFSYKDLGLGESIESLFIKTRFANTVIVDKLIGDLLELKGRFLS